MRSLTLVLALVLALGLLPAAGATAPQRQYAFTSSLNAGSPLAGTLALATSTPSSGGAVNLPVNQPVTWVYPTPLAAPAPFNNGGFSFDLYLTNPSGDIQVLFGDYEKDPATQQWHFHALKASPRVTVQSAPRNTIAPLGTLPVPSLNIGHARADIAGIAGTLPQGAYPAFQVVSGTSNGLYTTAGTLGATSSSSATVPLPELPAAALLGLGALVVGAVVALRKGWN